MKHVMTLMMAATLFIGCKKIDAAKGTAVEHTVDLNTFSAIDFGISGQLDYQQSNTTSIVVTANEKVFKAMDIEVKDDVLHIKKKKNVIFKNSDQIMVKVTSPNINALTLSGSGEVDAKFDTSAVIPNLDFNVSGSGFFQAHQVKATNQTLKVSGSGDLRIHQLESDQCTAKISGSGLINITGTSQSSDVTISGSGAYNGFNLLTSTSVIKTSGSGLGEIHADSTLDVTISGSGSVFYKGLPAISTSISGSGSLNSAN